MKLLEGAREEIPLTLHRLLSLLLIKCIIPQSVSEGDGETVPSAGSRCSETPTAPLPCLATSMMWIKILKSPKILKNPKAQELLENPLSACKLKLYSFIKKV